MFTASELSLALPGPGWLWLLVLLLASTIKLRRDAVAARHRRRKPHRHPPITTTVVASRPIGTTTSDKSYLFALLNKQFSSSECYAISNDEGYKRYDYQNPGNDAAGNCRDSRENKRRDPLEKVIGTIQDKETNEPSNIRAS